VQSIQDPDAHSPLFTSWQGVAVNRVSELEVQFSLVNPYAFFGDDIKNLYILPKHLFADTPPGNWHLSDYNLKPIGSGPYQFASYEKNNDGFISAYHLEAWGGTGGQKPLIQNYDFQFFNDENSLVSSFNNGQIDGFGDASPQALSEINRPYDLFAWRTSSYYAVFFNQSKNLALQDPAVRSALSAALDRNALIGQTFGGNGKPEYGPLPPDTAYFASATATSSVDFASTTLGNDGWTVAASSSDGFRSKTIGGVSIPLTINLTVPQIDFLATTADFVRAAWQQIGVQTNVNLESPDDVVNQAIKNRDYEALLFGNVLGPSSDLYSFWDSSQRFYPGLNLAIYSNKNVDVVIEDARANMSSTAIAADFAKAQAGIMNDNPAIFLYSPDYVYVTNKNVQGISPDLLSDPSDRFREVPVWYLNTARVLK
jgi:peptide/nickel transport system substrate-binding protein